MTLTKISSKSNPNPIYEIGTVVVDRYNGRGIVSSYKYCKNYGCELPIVRFANHISKFSHPECLLIVASANQSAQELTEDICEPPDFEPPDPDDYLGQSLPLANPMLEGIRRLDWECQKVRIEINFLQPHLLATEPPETLLTSYSNAASKRLSELYRLLRNKQAAAQRKALTLKLKLDLSATPWLIKPMDGWYSSSHLEEQLNYARDDWLHEPSP